MGAHQVTSGLLRSSAGLTQLWASHLQVEDSLKLPKHGDKMSKKQLTFPSTLLCFSP